MDEVTLLYVSICLGKVGGIFLHKLYPANYAAPHRTAPNHAVRERERERERER